MQVGELHLTGVTVLCEMSSGVLTEEKVNVLKILYTYIRKNSL